MKKQRERGSSLYDDYDKEVTHTRKSSKMFVCECMYVHSSIDDDHDDDVDDIIIDGDDQQERERER